MIVDQAVPEDTAAILALLHERPGADTGNWSPIPGAVWLVARDEQGIAAFLAARIDLDRREIVGDQMEAEASVRGRRGLKLLGDFVRAKARQLGCIIYSVVAADNLRHSAALEARGFKLSARVYAWDPAWEESE